YLELVALRGRGAGHRVSTSQPKRLLPCRRRLGRPHRNGLRSQANGEVHRGISRDHRRLEFLWVAWSSHTVVACMDFGNLISSRAPCSGRLSMKSSPPMALTRSLITKGPRRDFSSAAVSCRPANPNPRPL